MNIEDDLCDYPMSDTAICEARLVGLAPGLPYRLGFRRQRPIAQRRPSLKRILALDDEDFRRFIKNGCQLPGENQDIEVELARLNSELEALQFAIVALSGRMEHGAECR